MYFEMECLNLTQIQTVKPLRQGKTFHHELKDQTEPLPLVILFHIKQRENKAPPLNKNDWSGGDQSPSGPH